MKKVIQTIGMILLLCVPVVATAQIGIPDRANRDRATQMGANMERTIKLKEPNWKLKGSLKSDFGSHHYFKADKGEVDISIYVYDSPEEASRQLRIHATWSSLTAESKLEGIGDEAFYMSHRLFSWIGVRKGNTLVEVRGPGPELTVTRRFVRYGLNQLEK